MKFTFLLRIMQKRISPRFLQISPISTSHKVFYSTGQKTPPFGDTPSHSEDFSSSKQQAKRPRINVKGFAALLIATGTFLAYLLKDYWLLKQAKAMGNEQEEKKSRDNFINEVTERLEEINKWLKTNNDLTELDARLYLFNKISPTEGKKHADIERLLKELFNQLTLDLEKLTKENHLKCPSEKEKRKNVIQLIEKQLTEIKIAEDINKAQLKRKRYHYKEALSAIDDALDLLGESMASRPFEDNPTIFLQALNLKAKIKAASGEKEEAAKLYREAINLNPESSKQKAILNSSLGALLNDMGEHEKAFQYHLVAEKETPEDAMVKINISYGLRCLALEIEMKWQEKVSKEINAIDAKESRPDEIRQYRLGAKTRLESVLQNEELPKNQKTQAYLFLGITYMEDNDKNTARYYFEKGLAEDKDHPTLLRRNALVLSLLGEHKAALGNLEKAKCILEDYTNKEIPAYQAWLENIKPRLPQFKANVAFMEGDLPKAEALLIEAIQVEKKENIKQEMLFNLIYIKQLQTRIPNSRQVNPAEVGIITHYEYAVLSQQVYEFNGGKPPSDWDVLETNTVRNNDGYQGVIYVNHKTKDIVIAHRGTDSLKNVITDMKLLLFHYDDYANQANQLTEKAKVIAEEQGIIHYRMSHTGHSLGGAIAEAIAYHHNSSAVTFESPGSRELIERNIKNHANPNATLDEARVNVIGYLAEPNLINTARRHIGILYRIYPLIPADESYFGWFQDSMASLLGLRDIRKTLKRHAMNNIVDLFRATKQPAQKEIIDWPCGLYLDYQAYEKKATECEEKNENRDCVEILDDFCRTQLIHYDLRPANLYKLSLQTFPEEIRKFLVGYHKIGNAYYQKNQHGFHEDILTGYRIENDTIVIINGLTAEEFKQYIEKRTFQPRLRCTYKEPASFNFWKPTFWFNEPRHHGKDSPTKSSATEFTDKEIRHVSNNK